MTLKASLVILTLCGISACTAEYQSYPNTTISNASTHKVDDVSYRSSPSVSFTQQEVRPIENTSVSFSNPKTIMKGNLNENNVETSAKGVISISPHNGSETADIPDSYWVHTLAFCLIGVITYLAVECNRSHC